MIFNRNLKKMKMLPDMKHIISTSTFKLCFRQNQ